MFNRLLPISIFIGFSLLLVSLPLASAETGSDPKVIAESLLQRGSTHHYPMEQNLEIVGEAPIYSPSISTQGQYSLEKPLTITAPMTESIQMDLYIPAKEYLAIQFEHTTQSLNIVNPQQNDLISETAQSAVDKSPRWIRNDLITVFASLEPSYQAKWAEVILSANDPYIDEIAFCIAHLSPQYLKSSFAFTQLLVRNVELIYQHDQVLDYVEVIDYGTSQNDPDYYSTTKYRKAKYLDTLEVEVPRDIYYWYIVHPKISDEIPAFIDPDIIESNYSHSNNIMSPENGYFWRDFLLNHNDPGYALLKDLLKECKIVWNQFGGSLPGADPAINVLSRWLSRSMTFTSNEERPHQPVRIYRKHIGRCGEYSDMRAAIARAALIPAATVASSSTDHAWNEFWDQNWIHWDDAIDDPYMYLGSGWNKKFGSVFRWRSDGCLIPVTDRYTREQATIHIYALDRNDNPIDGARIILYTTGLDGTIWFDTYGVTDNQGKASFIVGTERPYHAKMQCDYGNVPAGDSSHLLRVVSNSQVDREYSVSMTIDAEKPAFLGEDIGVPQFENERFYLRIEFDMPFQILRGTDLFDDLEKNASQFIQQPAGVTNFIMMDEQNYQNFTSGNAFQGFHTSYQTDSDTVGFEFDGSSDWYCVFDNSTALHTSQHLTGTVQLMSVYDASVPEVALMPTYPNPVYLKNNEATITFQVPRKTRVELKIYNLLGQEVKTLIDDLRYAGQFSINWDGKDMNDRMVPTGVYLCRIATDHGDAYRKMLVIH